MATFEIKKATRKLARARVGVSGPSGAGKSMSALRLAKGIVDGLRSGGVAIPEAPIGAIDSERGSLSLYADVADFVVIDLAPPYKTERFIEALHALERHGCLVVIIDQISHAWAGEGGLLEQMDVLKAGARNKMAPWAQITPMHQRFLDSMLQSPAHIIATMRSKTEWVINEDTRKPEKLGLAPVQRDGIEFEFTSMLDIDISHQAIASKDRTRLFDGRRFQIDENCGVKLAEWLLAGAPDGTQELAQSLAPKQPLPPAPATRTPQEQARRQADPPEGGFGEEPPPPSDADVDPGPVISDAQRRKLWAAVGEKAEELGLAQESVGRFILQQFGIESSKAVPKSVFNDVLTLVQHLKREDLPS